MSRSGQVFHQDDLAGIITENEDGYFLHYDTHYLEQVNAQPIDHRSLHYTLNKSGQAILDAYR